MKKVDIKLPAVAIKVTSLLRTTKKPTPVPMFNQPLPSACPHHRMSRILFAISLSFLVAMSIPVITLKAISYNFLSMNQDTGFVFQTTGDNGEAGIKVIMAALPRFLFLTPTKIILIAAVVIVVSASAHLGFVILDWKEGKRTQAWAFRRNIMFVHIINSILILLALVSIFATHKSSSHLWDGYVKFRTTMTDGSKDPKKTVFRYNIGTFDLETWSCEMKDVPGASMVHDDYAKQCSIEIAGRGIMIPFMILVWAVAGISIWGLVGGGRRGPDGDRVKTENVGLEMDKMNAI
ncbi:hypothetical protein ACEQ8H_001987 [Pleosporales sp. CAS-2024a]